LPFRSPRTGGLLPPSTGMPIAESFVDKAFRSQGVVKVYETGHLMYEIVRI